MADVVAGNVMRYDPERVRGLHRRALAAIADLATVASTDPAAAAAMGDVRLARSGLEREWLPLLERVLSSDAMLTWSAAGPDGLFGRWSEWAAWLGGLAGPDLGRELAVTARRVVDDGDVDDIEDLTATLGRHGDDAAAMRAFFADLGGAGTADLLMHLGTRGDHPDEAIALATVLRARLSEASQRPGFPAGIAPSRLTAAIPERERNPAVALAFLFDDTQFGTDFVVAAARALVERELAYAEDERDHGAMLWFPTAALAGPGSVLYRPLDADDDGNDSSEFLRAGDPMYAVLETLAGDGAAGRAVFTDDRLAEYLLGQRDVRADGMRSLAAAAATAAAGPDVVPGADDDLLRDAAEVASAFVNHVGGRDHDHVAAFYDNAAVSRSAATILGQHMISVHNAVLLAEAVAPPAGGLIPIEDETRGDGPIVTGALLDEDALDVVTDLAVGSEDGVGTIRAALDLHQEAQATAGVGRIAAGEIADADRFLREAVADAARLEAYFIEHVGHRAEAMGRSVDDAITFWTDLASFSISVGKDRLGGAAASAGSVVAPVLGEALGPAAELAQTLFATHEASAARTAAQDADAAADQLTYVWYRQLYGQGIVVPTLPADAVAGGELIAWEDFQHLDPADRQVTRNRMEETTGRVNIEGNALRDVIKVQQLPIYQELR